MHPYDETWPAAFDRARRQLADVLGPVPVEHIGSTAVPGMPAKPVIDIAARVADPSAVDDEALAGIGFERNPGGPRTHPTYVRDSGGRRTHILHLYPPAQWQDLNQLLLRDLLRSNPEAARRYGELKLRLAAEGLSGRAYTAAKTELVQELTDTARRASGLPP
ncbi:MAG TPA: GrpB family protein, partial [Kribbellaceae bacterium]